MTSNDWNTRALAGTDSDLLENETIDANFYIRMDDNTVGVWNQEAAPDLAVERDIGSGDDRPETMRQY